MQVKKDFFTSIAKDVFLFGLLLIFVLIVNFSIISFDMMYLEQPLIYVANQSIHSIRDLFSIYLHPKLFHLAIPFFRPTGHFLIYQLLMPFLGWHNTKGCIIVNLFFLALTGYLIIKLYNFLFPLFKVGGYIAFSLYLMHPALILSRLITLHFEFAYIFFTLLSLYCFVKFQRCQRFLLLAWSLLFYVIATTFKESALMLGPVLISYFCISLYSQQPVLKYFYGLMSNKQTRQIIILILIVSFTLAIYLTLPWKTWSNPISGNHSFKEISEATKIFLKIIFGLTANPSLNTTNLLWNNIVFSSASRFIIWFFWVLSLMSAILLCNQKQISVFKKPIVFLFFSFLLFLVLPIAWAEGHSWHLSLSLICLSMMMGFSAEYLCGYVIKHKTWIYVLGVMSSVGIGITAITVNCININHILARASFVLNLNHNAVFHPPDIKGKLNAQSVIVVEDNILNNDYLLGASHYPFHTRMEKVDFNVSEKFRGLFLKKNVGFYEFKENIQNVLYLRIDPIYNGRLFRWAYLMPSLQEEVYPFQAEYMEQVPDVILYNWLQHYNNIFCLGYDKNANWHDRTAIFKKKLIVEKARRNLVVNEYEILPAIAMVGNVTRTNELLFPDYQICQLECDQDKQCKGFTYLNAELEHHSVTKCLFYNFISLNNQKFCPLCIGFVKGSVYNP